MQFCLKIKLLLLYFLWAQGLFAQEIGHISTSFYDSDRNRDVSCEIYYPSDETGEDVSVAAGEFPIIIFGHGFLMEWSSYENYWTHLVPQGYILCFPTTETSLSPSHSTFGGDIRFLANQLLAENMDNSSLFYQSIANKVALMGHSMGGGAATLAAENNTTIDALILLAPAETTPSAIDAASNIEVPSLVFSGDDDCVTPEADHQIPIYNNLEAACKNHISIINGGHCYFADYNFSCSLGESFCNSELNITESEQHQIVFNFLDHWLDYTLKDNTQAIDDFNDSLENNVHINYTQSCNTSNIDRITANSTVQITPNPVTDQLSIQVPNLLLNGKLTVYNMTGKTVYSTSIKTLDTTIVLAHLRKGLYTLTVQNEAAFFSDIFIKVD